MKRTNGNSSWTVVMIAASFILVIQSISFFFSLKGIIPSGPVSTSLRGASAFLAALVLALTPYLRTKKIEGLATYCFLFVMLPNFPIIWINHDVFMEAGLPWLPLAGPKLLFFVLAVLVPGPFWINGLLMVILALESMAMWFVLDLSSYARNQNLPEPWYTIMFGMICFVLLVFRGRDEQIIRRLSVERARAESMEILAKVFLGLRDLSNTPLQTLITSVEILKRRVPEAGDLVEPMRDAVERLARMNRILTRFESQVTWIQTTPMTEEEILEWISKIEEEKG